jgi:hypothetical protein
VAPRRIRASAGRYCMRHSKAAERSLNTAREWQPSTTYDAADMEHGSVAGAAALGRRGGGKMGSRSSGTPMYL